MTELLGRRALNRALLARQHLLGRVDRPVLDAVDHLVGLQAQATLPPYVGLWSRLADFDPHELGQLLTDRRTVRLTLMRATVHLVSVRDALLLRPLVQVVVERGHNGAFGRRMGGVDPAELAAAVRALLDDGPLTARELGRRLVARGIGTDVEAVGDGARVHVPLVQVPPRGVWGAAGQAMYVPIERWTGLDLDPAPSIDAVVLRYLAAFGPASVRDVQSWSGLTKLASVLERLRPRLVTFRDDRDTELFDLPDAPRPGPDVPAPVRLLGEFDNVLLGHADRRRVIPDAVRGHWLGREGRAVNSLLVDGELAGTWWTEREGTRRATLAVRPYGALGDRDRAEVREEAGRLLELMAVGTARREVRVDAPAGG